MFQSTPPKSKMTARGLIAAGTSARGHPGADARTGVAARCLRREVDRLLLVGGERQPPALSQTLLVDLTLLLTRGAIALEVGDRVVDAGLVPLPFGNPAAGEHASDDEQYHESLDHAAHDSMAAPCSRRPSPAACPNPRGSRARTCCGRPGCSRDARSSKASTMPCAWHCEIRKTPASTSSPTASRAAATSCGDSWRRSTAWTSRRW